MKVPLHIRLLRLGARVVVGMGALILFGVIFIAAVEGPGIWASSHSLESKLVYAGAVTGCLMGAAGYCFIALNTLRRINRNYFSKQPNRDEKPPT